MSAQSANPQSIASAAKLTAPGDPCAPTRTLLETLEARLLLSSNTISGSEFFRIDARELLPYQQVGPAQQAGADGFILPRTLDLDTFASGPIGDELITAGYRLSDPGGGAQGLILYDALDGSGYDSTVIQNDSWARTIRLERLDGEPFALNSFDFAAGRWDQLADAFVTGTRSNGSQAHAIISSATKTMTTLELAWSDLTHVDINYAGGSSEAFGALDQFDVADGVPDNSGPGRISVESVSRVAGENESALAIKLVRTEGISGSVSVDFKAFNGTAIAGEDYLAPEGRLTFESGQVIKTLTINLLDDATDEPQEYLSYVLSNPDNGLTLGDARGVILIDDNEATAPNGTGLLASYFDQSDLKERSVLRIDSTIDFDWTGSTPDPAIDPSEFSVRWSGQVLPAYTETTQFTAMAPDGLRLWIDGVLMVDTWDNPSGGGGSGSVALQADVPVSIAMEVRVNAAATDGAVDLSWSSPSLAQEKIPTDRLFPADDLHIYDEHLYVLTDVAMTWADAEAEAQRLGGHLVTLNSNAENQWIVDTFGTSEPLWLGLNDATIESTFTWTSGESSAYVNWTAGYPTSATADHDFAAMNFSGTQWADFGPNERFRGLIEIGSGGVTGGDDAVDGRGFGTRVLATGLVQPTAFEYTNDGRIFVAQKAGQIVVVENGVVISTFLDINERVISSQDRGLIGMKLDPDFDNNGYVYLQYTVDIDPENPDGTDDIGHTGELIRVTASAADRNVADMSTQVLILDGHMMSNFSHSVGDVDFDNDGNLIFSWGDGGFDNNLRLATQNPDSVQGKLFRINPTTFEGVPENPYYEAGNPSSTRSKVWVVGLRNSWRFTVDRPTGDVYLGDVTDAGPEEINVIRGDGSSILNLGWPYYEGDVATQHNPNPPEGFEYESPLTILLHVNNGQGDAIIGGAVYRGSTASPYPSQYDGRYFYANYAQGQLYTADQDGSSEPFGAPFDHFLPTDLHLGPSGELEYVSVISGELIRLIYNGDGSGGVPVTAVAKASIYAGPGPLKTTLNATDSTGPVAEPLRYAWDFDGDGNVDSTEAAPAFTFSESGKHIATALTISPFGGIDRTEIELTVLSQTPTDDNVALGKPTEGSSPDKSFGGLSSRANDGTNSSTDSASRTILTRTPIWEVDLGQSYDLRAIEIFDNTELTGSERLSDFWILISDQPFSSSNLNAARADPGVFSQHFDTAGDFLSVDVSAESLSGRYIRIQRASEEAVLGLSEVRVIGTAS